MACSCATAAVSRKRATSRRCSSTRPEPSRAGNSVSSRRPPSRISRRMKPSRSPPPSSTIRNTRSPRARQERRRASAVRPGGAALSGDSRPRRAGNRLRSELLVGGPALIREVGAHIEPRLQYAIDRAASRGHAAITLLQDEVPLAVFAVADAVREESREAVRRLHEQQVEVIMRTGDAIAVANACSYGAPASAAPSITCAADVCAVRTRESP